LLRLGHEDKALRVLDDFIESRPGDAWGHMNRAWALVRLGRIDEALESADRAVELRPGWPETYWKRAAHASASHRPDLCEQIRTDFAKVDELATGRVWSANQALLMVLNFYYNCPDLYDAARALELAREGAEYDAKDPFGHGVHGVALYRNGRFAEARDALRRALELVSDEESYLFFLSMTSFELGDHMEAREYYDRAVGRINSRLPKKNPLTIRLKQEAAELLGIQP
jgi:tetratricopeptide (TPR) repeat protein